MQMTKARTALLAAALLGLVGGGAFSTACRRSPEHAAQATATTATRYQCPMHPKYVAEKPGACPICWTALVPIAHQVIDVAPRPAGTVPGRAAISLSPERRRVLGLRSAPVERANLKRTIRTVGRVTADERRLHHVHTKLEGYVERLFVDFVGKEVRRGEPLVSIF